MRKLVHLIVGIGSILFFSIVIPIAGVIACGAPAAMVGVGFCPGLTGETYLVVYDRFNDVTGQCHYCDGAEYDDCKEVAPTPCPEPISWATTS